ncbi:MAG: hypothetical protein A3I05_07800 [Deltaproteobacteria bacterium RIFCSPLOWO2_02_FULL_44_10]|nr:MAG: hypothetical protein A3C46_03635 [Deltaproteobacteria bacterium RIFCSPHIGHO2_02_FULL_44_16]OGQ47629.1 MAG: hypothetical protein A3I05_07800 [Deltaproteobacteria bacterium RIFCSPLOWO2_02_FULL_44_10]
MRRRYQQQPKRKRKWVKRFLLLILCGGVGLFLYSKYLAYQIEEKFDRARKWNLPSRVFSDAEYLYPGIDINTRKLLEKLDRLGYRNTGSRIEGPGDYAKARQHLDIYLHDFDYPGDRFRGFPLRIELDRTVIVKLLHREEKKELELARLEPEVVASIFDERMEDRTVVTLEEVPPSLLEAIILIEDERFFKHHGIDPVGIARALVANIKAVGIVQGGSTLTQQLIKNFFLHPRKSFLRKINEQLMALELERHHSKSEILQAYINEIYLGQRGASSVSGVAEAAKYYFGKNVKQLTVAESAYLAGMIQSPGRYSPFTNLEKGISRRNQILMKMLKAELLSEKEYHMAINEVVVSPKQKMKRATAPFFIDFVKQELAANFSEELLESEGLRIFTTLDMHAQVVAEEVIDTELKKLETAYASLLPKNHPDPLETCLISIQPSNGYIRTMVGGRDYERSQFNRCAQAHRQPGSTFKPFVYLTAFDQERSQVPVTPSTLIEDRSFTVEAGGEPWSPRNYDEEEHGTITVRTALENSYNIATAKLAIQTGLENVVQTAREAGIHGNLLAVPSLALGAFEVTPLELASAYTLFPNSGIRAEPISLLHVVTKEGEVLERRRVKMQRRFDPRPVYVTTHVLRGVMDRGTGVGARALGLSGVVAGKTGTTSDYRDAWFVGFTPDLLALTWVGFDDNAEMKKMSGARAALPMWTAFMKKVIRPGSQDFTRPNDVVLIKVDHDTGGLATSRCPDYLYEAFIEGTEPTESCNDIDISHELPPKESQNESY